MVSRLEMRGSRIVESMRFIVVGLAAKALVNLSSCLVIFRDPPKDRKDKVKRCHLPSM
jgi:hypothetical protein